MPKRSSSRTANPPLNKFLAKTHEVTAQKKRLEDERAALAKCRKRIQELRTAADQAQAECERIARNEQAAAALLQQYEAEAAELQNEMGKQAPSSAHTPGQPDCDVASIAAALHKVVEDTPHPAAQQARQLMQQVMHLISPTAPQAEAAGTATPVAVPAAPTQVDDTQGASALSVEPTPTLTASQFTPVAAMVVDDDGRRGRSGRSTSPNHESPDSRPLVKRHCASVGSVGARSRISAKGSNPTAATSQPRPIP